MILQTVVRDCLYVNWAIPCAALPPLPDGLRPEEHEEAGERFAFVSLVCFRQERLHHELAPFLNVSYPQCNLRLHVRDGEGWESGIVRAFGVKEIPFSVVVAADGRVMAVNAEGKGLEKAVAGAVKE